MNRRERQLPGKLVLGISVMFLALLVGCALLAPNATIPQSLAPDATASAHATTADFERGCDPAAFTRQGKTILVDRLISGLGHNIPDAAVPVVVDAIITAMERAERVS